jgi:hypothetical protein
MTERNALIVDYSKAPTAATSADWTSFQGRKKF